MTHHIGTIFINPRHEDPSSCLLTIVYMEGKQPFHGTPQEALNDFFKACEEVIGGQPHIETLLAFVHKLHNLHMVDFHKVYQPYGQPEPPDFEPRIGNWWLYQIPTTPAIYVQDIHWAILGIEPPKMIHNT